jgi:hypothetical protein
MRGYFVFVVVIFSMLVLLLLQAHPSFEEVQTTLLIKAQSIGLYEKHTFFQRLTTFVKPCFALPPDKVEGCLMIASEAAFNTPQPFPHTQIKPSCAAVFVKHYAPVPSCPPFEVLHTSQKVVVFTGSGVVMRGYEVCLHKECTFVPLPMVVVINVVT